MKLSKKVIGGIVAVAIVLLFVVTVPNKDDHTEAIMQKCVAEMQQEEKSNEANAGVALGASMVAKVLPTMLQVDNYGVVSVGKLVDGDKSKTISVGVLGHVFVGDLDDKMKDSDKKKKDSEEKE